MAAPALSPADLGPEFQPLRETALALPQQAECITIETREDLELATGWLREEVLGRITAIEEFFGPRKKRLYDSWKDMVALEKQALEPCETARRIIDRATLAYHQREEARRRAAEEAARVAQRAAERRAAILTGIERFAGVVTYCAQAEELEAKKRAEAEAAAAAGDVELASAIAEQAAEAPPPPPEPEPVMPELVEPTLPLEQPKVAGVSVRKNYKARVTNMLELVKHVAAHPEFINLLELNQSSADKLAKSLEEKLSSVIPGLAAENAASVTRSRR